MLDLIQLDFTDAIWVLFLDFWIFWILKGRAGWLHDNRDKHNYTYDEITKWDEYPYSLVFGPIVMMLVIWVILAFLLHAFDFILDGSLNHYNKTIWVYIIYLVITFVGSRRQDGTHAKKEILHFILGLFIWISLSILYKLW